jgi:hypothetical protein
MAKVLAEAADSRKWWRLGPITKSEPVLIAKAEPLEVDG